MSCTILGAEAAARVALLLGLIANACTSADVVTPAPTTARVSRAAIEAEIDRYVCAAWLDEAQLYEARFSDLRCAGSRTDDEALAAAVLRALDDCVVLVALAAAAYDRAYAGLEPPGSRSQAQLDEVVRDAYRSDPHLAPAMLERSVHYLAQQSVECSDCPAPPLIPQKVLTWAEFTPYIAAYLWPTRAADEAGAHIYICSAQNGVQALGLRDTQLLEAGFLAAVALAEAETTRSAIADLVARELELPEATTAIAELIASAPAIAVACQSVADKAWFTGVSISDCAAE